MSSAVLSRVLFALAIGLTGFGLGRISAFTPAGVPTSGGAVPPESPGPRESSTRPDIILVTMDALRADHLGLYGYTRETSPWLDAFAARGVVFDANYAGSSWTVPSMATLFTSLYAWQHRIDRGQVSEGRVRAQPVLPASISTLAERLKEAGYTTFGVATNSHLSLDQGFAQGFDYFVNEGFQDAPFVHQQVADWRNELQSAKPYFLWVHFFDPHDRYRSRRPWVETFDEDAARRVPSMLADGAVARDRRLQLWSSMMMRELVKRPEPREKPEVRETLMALYDSEIRYMDDWIGRVFDLLSPGPDTIVVLTADHGEEFLDHGNLGHRKSLFDELVRVPLLVSWPDRIEGGRRIGSATSGVDLLPTLVQAATGDAPHGDQVAGMSLLPALEGQSTLPERSIYLEVHQAGTTTQAVVQLPWKLVRNVDGGPPTLYNLQVDPAERHDVAGKEPLRLGQLLGDLDGWLSRAWVAEAPGETTLEDAGTLEQLQAMGYLDDAPQ